MEESYFDELDRDFLSLSSKMDAWSSWTYGMLGYRLVAPLDPNKFDNAASKAKEIGIRALIVLGYTAKIVFAGLYIAATAVVLKAGSKLFQKAGWYFQKNGFTHVKGSAPETVLKQGQAAVMTWNIRGHAGGLHYAHGVVHWRSRVDRIVDNIVSENPDVVILHDVQDIELREALIAKLKDLYAHFYIHLSESGCMVATKCAIHNFSHTQFAKEDPKWGFATLEIKASPKDTTPCARIIGTQLSPGADAAQKRMGQVAQIVDTLAKETISLPTLFVGSLHMDRDSDTELSKYLCHSYLDKGPTHSDELANQWAPIDHGQEESSDFISFFKRTLPDGRTLPVIQRGIRLLDSHLVQAFDENYNTKTALSDHHAVVTTFSGLFLPR